MDCPDKQLDLQAYVDGDLDPERITLLENHLAECDTCRMELAHLQLVVEALESWPLVGEPPTLTDRIMAQVGTRSAPPRFRLRWSDAMLSLAGAGLAITAVLLWRYVPQAIQTYLYRSDMRAQLEVLRLHGRLFVHRLAKGDAMTWWPLLAGVALVVVLTLSAWDLTTRRQRTFFA